MKEVEIKLRFDLENGKERDKFQRIIDIYGADDMPAAVTLQPAKGHAKAEEKPAKMAKPASVPAPAQEQENEDTDLTLEELRAMMATKQDEHRSELKAKLTELGANNLRSLPAEKYQEFYEFMQNL